jgi:acetyl esterase/lipase
MEFDVEDVEYLRHGAIRYGATIYRPRGAGPFPAVVDAHGGAWVGGRREMQAPIDSALAEQGVTVMTIDFRNPPEATYPGSIADMNYAIRWLKGNAARFAVAGEHIGTMGVSSGGHIAVLAALKPQDLRYAAIPFADGIDARVPFVVTLWPVICPLGRYRAHIGKMTPDGPTRANLASQTQMRYWLSEEAMAEGSAYLAVERGDPIEMPHILYCQHAEDMIHPRDQLEGFIRAYRRRGGSVELVMFDDVKFERLFHGPTSPEGLMLEAARQTVELGLIERVAAFIHKVSDLP